MSRQQLNVHNLPHDVAEKALAGGVAVVIDLLRATTTICHALAAGAAEVVPLLEVDEAREAAAKAIADGASVVLGGERAGGRITGFDLGNSPSEYSPEAVCGRRVIMTTTNGTRALHHARLARRVVVGGFVNLSAIVASLVNEPRIDILCAGTDGEATREDILVAGAIAAALANSKFDSDIANDAAIVARHEWNTVLIRARKSNRSLIEQVAVELRDTPGGRNLLGIGMDQDLVDSAQINRFAIIPELDLPNWRIILPNPESRPC